MVLTLNIIRTVLSKVNHNFRKENNTEILLNITNMVRLRVIFITEMVKETDIALNTVKQGKLSNNTIIKMVNYSNIMKMEELKNYLIILKVKNMEISLNIIKTVSL